MMVVSHNMGPALQLVGVRFWNFLIIPSRKAITRVQTTPNVDISRNSNGYISLLRDATFTWFCTLVVLHVLCMTRSNVKVKVTEHLNFRQLPITAHF